MYIYLGKVDILGHPKGVDSQIGVARSYQGEPSHETWLKSALRLHSTNATIVLGFYFVFPESSK